MEYALRMSDPFDHPVSVTTVCDALGRRNIADRVRRGVTAVSNAVSDGLFPASWYLAIKAMCRDAGIECPDALFKFVPSPAPSAEDPTHDHT